MNKNRIWVAKEAYPGKRKNENKKKHSGGSQDSESAAPFGAV